MKTITYKTVVKQKIKTTTAVEKTNPANGKKGYRTLSGKWFYPDNKNLVSVA